MIGVKPWQLGRKKDRSSKFKSNPLLHVKSQSNSPYVTERRGEDTAMFTVILTFAFQVGSLALYKSSLSYSGDPSVDRFNTCDKSTYLCLGTEAAETRVPLADPAIELWDTHGRGQAGTLWLDGRLGNE